jgi:hypothetical protein
MSRSSDWWLRTKQGHMVLGTLSFAIPITVYFGMKMYERGVFTFRNVLLLLILAVGFGALAAISMWNVWLKRRM